MNTFLDFQLLIVHFAVLKKIQPIDNKSYQHMNKSIHIIALIGFIVLLSLRNHQQTPFKDFQQWKAQFGTPFQPSEEPYRRIIFEKNLKLIEAHNKDPTQTYKMGINQFSIYNQQQFKLRFLVDITVPYDIKISQEIQVITPVNAVIDWTTQGKVSRVKNQGQCGSCWAFSATGVAESYALFFNQNWDLSQQQLVDCSGPYGNGGCSGGYPSKALLYVRDHGLSTQATYPYVGQNRACQRNGGQFRINSVGSVAGCVGLMNGITSRPLSITVDASNWGQYHSGVFNNCAANINHCVLLVGTDANGVWKIKNSWGTAWGEGGYIRLAPGNTCGVCAYGGVFIS